MKAGDTSISRKRKIRCCAYLVAGVIAQTIIILVFILLVLRIRNIKVRLENVTLENLKVSSSSFSVTLNAQVTVKNTNFGHFKFKNSTLVISYRGTPVGEAITMVKGRVRARSMKKFNETVLVSSYHKVPKNSDQLSPDIDSGIVNLSSHVKIDGKVHLFKVIRKKKKAEMSCTMDVNISLKQIQNFMCK